MLALGGLAVLSGAGFMIYKGVANGADVKTEQANVQVIANNADRIQGALGSFAGLTTTAAISQRIPPQSMVAGGGLLSRWSQPVLLEPTDVGAKSAAGLKITYQAVPARACAKFVSAAAGGMFDVQVGDHSVLDRGRLNIDAAISRCADGAPVSFTYYGGATGLAGAVLDPVFLPPLNPPHAPPPVAPPPAPPPAAPPISPPAPGCGAAPMGSATGTTPAGQTCSFVWNAVAAPTCWAPLALCTPVIAAPPPAPPPSSPPSSPPPSGPPPSTPVCSAPAPLVTSEPNTASCLAGRSTPSGASTFAQNRTKTVTYACPDPFGAVVPTTSYTPWTPTEAAACAPICSAPAALAETQSGPMDSKTTSYTQAGPVDSKTTPYTQAGPVDSKTTPYTQAGPVASMTTPYTQAGPVASKSTTYNASPPCPPSQTGVWNRTRTGTQTSPTTQTRTGTQTSPTTQTRTGTQTSPTTQTRTGTQTSPTTQTRTGTQTSPTTQTRITTYTCPAPTGSYTSTSTPWADTGVRTWSTPPAYTPWVTTAARTWSTPPAYTPWVTTAARTWSTPPAYTPWVTTAARTWSTPPAYTPWTDTGARTWSAPSYSGWVTTTNTCAPSTGSWTYVSSSGFGYGAGPYVYSYDWSIAGVSNSYCEHNEGRGPVESGTLSGSPASCRLPPIPGGLCHIGDAYSYYVNEGYGGGIEGTEYYECR